jgi:hypothetical protein
MICSPGDQDCHKKHPPEITNVGAGLSVNSLKIHNHQIKTCPSLNSIDRSVFYWFLLIVDRLPTRCPFYCNRSNDNSRDGDTMRSILLLGCCSIALLVPLAIEEGCGKGTDSGTGIK